MKYKPVHIPSVELTNNQFRDDNKRWLVTSLIEKAKYLEVFELPLQAIYIGAEIWEPVGSAYELARHMKRALEVDIKKPVILDAEGFIMDGWHRVLRALIDGRPTIPAVRFEATPDPDYEIQDDAE